VAVFESGPSGGQGGNFFVVAMVFDESKHYVVSQINVWSGSYIDAIQLTYTDGESTGKIGGSGGSLTMYNLEGGEQIIELSGRYGSYIDSLSISTNLRTFPVLGGGGGPREYRYQAPDGMSIIGFKGSAGSYLDALGILYGYGYV
jgi:Jacalin-like lectin domain